MLSGRKYLFTCSSGNLQLVMKIPTDLQQILKAKWIKRSLKTAKIKDAELIYNGVVGKIQSSFALLRSGVLNDDQIIALRASILPSKRTSLTKPTLTLHQLIDQYIAERSPNWTLATRSSFDQKFRYMKNVLSNGIIVDFNRTDFISYRNILTDSGYQAKTVNIHISLLSSLLKWCVRHGYLTQNLAEGLQLKQEKSPDEQRKGRSKVHS